MDGSKFRNLGFALVNLVAHACDLFKFPCVIFTLPLYFALCPIGIYLNSPTSIGLEDENCIAVLYFLKC